MSKAEVNKDKSNKIDAQNVGGLDDNLDINSTEVYDEAEIASALEQGFLAKALAKQQEKMAPETHPDFDGVHCIDCDTEIPPKRLEMKRIRCVDCQTFLEEKEKRAKR